MWVTSPHPRYDRTAVSASAIPRPVRLHSPHGHLDPGGLLGLGLAAATGLRTFLPLLLLSAAVHFELFGVVLNESMQWLGSTSALVA